MSQTAEVIQMHRATWDAVRVEYGKMTQMGWQSVVQAAKVGQMLIALKAECPHHGPGNFRSRSEVALPGVSADTIGNLMKIAANLPLLERHKPDSQRSALALIPKKARSAPKAEPAPEPKLIGWVECVKQHGDPVVNDFLGARVHDPKKKTIEAELGRKIPQRVPDDDDAIFEATKRVAYRRRPAEVAAVAEVTVAEVHARVPEDKRKTFDRLVTDAVTAEHKRLAATFWEQVEAEVEKRVAPQRAAYREAEAKSLREAENYRAATRTLDRWMTREEFRVVRSCLHSDTRKTKTDADYDRAFQIFNRLQAHVEPDKRARAEDWK